VWNEKPSLPLQDYVRIAFFRQGTNGELATQIHQETIKVTQVNNQLRIILSEHPDQIILDPDYMLIDSDRLDNVWER
jgi:hypothetical protein